MSNFSGPSGEHRSEDAAAENSARFSSTKPSSQPLSFTPTLGHASLSHSIPQSIAQQILPQAVLPQTLRSEQHGQPQTSGQQITGSQALTHTTSHQTLAQPATQYVLSQSAATHGLTQAAGHHAMLQTSGHQSVPKTAVQHVLSQGGTYQALAKTGTFQALSQATGPQALSQMVGPQALSFTKTASQHTMSQSGGQAQHILPQTIAQHSIHQNLGQHQLPQTVGPTADLMKYQAFPKTIVRQIAPVPIGTMAGSTTVTNVPSVVTQIVPTVIKTTVIETSAVYTSSNTAISAAASRPTQSALPTPMVQPNNQISAMTSQAMSTTPVSLGMSSIIRAAVPTQSSGGHHLSFPGSHLPRGAVAAVSALSGPRLGTAMTTVLRQPAAIQMSTSNTTAGNVGSLHTQIRGPFQTGLKTLTPPATRSPSPAVCITPSQSQPSDPSRLGKSLQSSTGTTTATPSIQITLQAPRTAVTDSPKSLPKQTHVAQPMGNMSKIVMSQASIPPILQQTFSSMHKPASNSLVMSTPSTSVSMSAIPTASTISTISNVSSTIPVAKVTPQRQQPVNIQTPMSQEHVRTEPAMQLPLSHTQPSTSIFIPQPRASPITAPLTTSISIPTPITHADTRAEHRTAIPHVPQYLPYWENYQQLMYQQLAQAQAGNVIPPISTSGSIRPGIIPSQTPNLAATLQAAAHGMTVTSAPTIRFNPMMVTVQEQLRQPQPMSVHTQYTTSAASVEGSTVATMAGMDSVTMTSQTIPVMATTVVTVPSLAGTLYSSQAQSPVSSQLSSTPISNPSASPRPSILRKRTNEGAVVVKKLVGLSSETHSPRPESRPDSAPQSNNSSPKTPAGESQSSTDTALSSDSTTPTQTSAVEIKIKQEPQDMPENGFPPVSLSPATNQSSSVEASPRKKPRKQLLHCNEELKDNTSSEEDFEKVAEVKEENTEVKQEVRDEYVDEDGIRWTLNKNRPPVSLLNFYNISWKPRNNHFQRYTDVKAKEERQATVNELSNQRGVLQKTSGWKLYHMAAQLEDLTGLEKELRTQVSQLQATITPKTPVKHSVLEDDISMVHELTQGNIQRCQLITDQLEEARSSMLKILDHKQKIHEIINKHMSKRPIKKKERT